MPAITRITNAPIVRGVKVDGKLVALSAETNILSIPSSIIPTAAKISA
jgi:hypothetical protein